MSQVISNLCTLLVDDVYGGLTSRIFGAILRQGRPSLQNIQQSTRLSLRQIRHGLSVLVQQHLVFWYAASDRDLTVYEANITAAYSLLWTGRYIHIARERFGELAGSAVSKLLLLGHARIRDLIQACSQEYRKDQLSSAKLNLSLGRDCTSDVKDSDTLDGVSLAFSSRMEETLSDMLSFGFISIVHKADCHSDADILVEAEKLMPDIDNYNAKSKKDKLALREMDVKAKILAWKLGTQEERKAIAELYDRNQRKRRLEDVNDDNDHVHTSRKRRKLDNNGDYEAGDALDQDEHKVLIDGALNSENVLRVNRDKFTVIFRNDHLVQVVEQVLGPTTSLIYGKFLGSIERKLRCCDGEEEPDNEENLAALPRLSTQEVAALLPPSCDLDDALAKVESRMMKSTPLQRRKRRRKKSTSSSEVANAANDNEHQDKEDLSSGSSEDLGSSDTTELTIDSEEDGDEANGTSNKPQIPTPSTDDAHMETVRQHLLLLANHPDRFLCRIRPSKSQSESWAINFRRLMRNIKLRMMLDTVTLRYGAPSARLMRICSERGRLDDKTLCTLSLIAQKEMRTRLLTLKRAGMLQLQEVPRDNARVASRTAFLYFLDEAKCSSKLIDECYKTVVRCLQRLDVEREKISGVLEKVDRSDIKGREEEFLGAKEKEALGRWTEVEERIWGGIIRVDKVVSVLRDY